MNPNQGPNAFSQHYLEIQALEPTADQNLTTIELPSTGWLISLPIILFFLVFIAGFGWMFYKRLQQVRSIFMVFIAALVVASLPLAMQLVNQKTSITTKADPDITPTNVIVKDVTPNSFVINWITSEPTTSTLKISTQPDMQTDIYVLNHPAERMFHQYTVDNLDPATTYYLLVLSNSQQFDHSGKPLEVTTSAR